MYLLAKYNTQTDFYFPMVKRGVVDLAVTADWTPATGDTKVSKDGGAVANTTNNPAIASGTSWKLTLTATELSAKWITVQIVDAATKAVEDQFLTVLTYGNASAYFIAPDYQDSVRMGLTALPNAAAGANGGLPLGDASARVDVGKWLGTAVTAATAGVPDTNAIRLGGTVQTGRDLGASVLLSAGSGTGQLDFTSGVVKANLAQILGTALTETAGQIAAGFKKVFDVAAPVFTATSVNQTGDAYARLGAPAGASVSADVAVVKTDTGTLTTRLSAGRATNLDNLDATISSRLPASSLQIRSATAQAGAGSTITLDASSSATDNLYNGLIVLLISGTGAGQARFVTGYVGATKVATVNRAWATNPDNTTVFGLLAFDLLGAADQVWDEAIAGHLTGGSTGASLNGAGSAGDPWTTALPGAYGAGTAGKIVGDNINATISSRATPAQILTTPANLLATDGSGRVTVGTNADKTGYALSSAGVQAIWDALTSALTTVGSIGKRLADFVTGDAYVRLGAPAGASVSADIASIKTDATTLTGRLTAGRATNLDNLDAAVSTRASSAALATVQADTDDIQTRLPAALVSGRMDASVGAVAANAITAAAIATNAIDADALATDAVTEIAAGVSAGSAPSAAANAAAVWSAVAATYNVAGSMGQKMNAAGGAADPLSNPVPGAYAAGTAGYALGALPSGIGSVVWTYTVTDTSTGHVLPGVTVWITSDAAGASPIYGPLISNALGQVQFLVDVGTLYVWRELRGYTFANPDVEVV